MNLEKLAELAPAYVALIIFVWYTLSRDRQHQADGKDRDERWEKFLGLQAEQYRAATKTQDEHWTGFLDVERQQRKEGMEMGMRQVDALVKVVRDIAGAIEAHDQAAQSRHDRVLEAVADHDKAVSDRLPRPIVRRKKR